MGALARLVERAFPALGGRSGQAGNGPTTNGGSSSRAAGSPARGPSAPGRTAAGDPVEETQAVWAAASWLVDYPGDELLARLPDLRRLVSRLPQRFGPMLDPVLDALSATDVEELRSTYVDTFDTRRRGCLHLTYFSHGDTRRRGLALVRVKDAYRRAGLVVRDDELPDHLTLVLELGAGHDAAAAEKILLANRAGLELLRLHLEDIGSPWHGAVEAVCATLPELDGEDRAAVRRLVEEGPAEEMVGLDGYGAEHDMPPLMHGDDTCSGHDHGPVPAGVGAGAAPATGPGGHELLPLTPVRNR
ncbi:nitrate reductase molybdenum cofactor assembly chaperone [Georgenia sp. Z1344]|uniref:nitrate reductase molybdenum cofactor assembly chaperone n=1 Tax=Georgenia sp. Z1344 TaxID=3416706 RepID=UPI003CF79ACA